jgi:hypothetical protein
LKELVIKGEITMTTIKSYTDLYQSKKLAKILSIDTADMEYMFLKRDGSKVGNVPFVKDGFEEPECCYIFIPCWSLTALLSVLPAECECMSLEHINYGNNHKKYFMSYVGGENTDTYDNPIDACVAMIERLHEQTLL